MVVFGLASVRLVDLYGVLRMCMQVIWLQKLNF